VEGVIVFGASALGGNADGGLDFFPSEAVVVFETDDLMGERIEFFEFLQGGDQIVMGGVVGGAVLTEGSLALEGVFGAGTVSEDLAHAIGDEGEEVFAVVDGGTGFEGD